MKTQTHAKDEALKIVLTAAAAPMAPSSAKAKVVNNWSFIVLVDDLILIVQVILIYEVNSHTSEEAEWTRVAVIKGHASHSRRRLALFSAPPPPYSFAFDACRVGSFFAIQKNTRVLSRREMAGRSVERRKERRKKWPLAKKV